MMKPETLQLHGDIEQLCATPLTCELTTFTVEINMNDKLVGETV